MGHPHLNYLDRYLKIPYYFALQIYFKKDEIKEIRNNNLNISKRKKFCAALLSNVRHPGKFRINFINELNKYKVIDMGGTFRNNIGKKIENKIQFLSSYKFSIAMENSEGDGYISEKIVDSFLSGTIPIYYGDYMIEEYINPETFILIRGEKDIQKKIEYIKQIDNDENLYKNILSKNLFLSNKYILNQFQKEFIEFFDHIFAQNKINSKRIDKYILPNKS